MAVGAEPTGSRAARHRIAIDGVPHSGCDVRRRRCGISFALLARYEWLLRLQRRPPSPLPRRWRG